MATFNITLPETPKTEKNVEEEQQEKPVEENKPEGLPEVIGASSNSKEEELAKKKLVVMDGSIARIYEKALNIVYAKEPIETSSVSNETHAIDSMLNAKYKAILSSETPDNPDIELYVYATDTQDMKLNLSKNISAISSLLKNKGSKDLYVAVESANNTLNKESIIFTNYCNSKNCRLFTNKDKCLRAIIAKCRG